MDKLYDDPEMKLRRSQTEPERPAGCSERPSSKAAVSEEANRSPFSPGPPITCLNRCYPRPYGEPLSDARTPLADFINSLLGKKQVQKVIVLRRQIQG